MARFWSELGSVKPPVRACGGDGRRQPLELLLRQGKRRRWDTSNSGRYGGL
jgi:hypothetical protein